jgi:cephalosporin hydroxylase
MDFYKSTYDVLEYLVEALIPNGSCVVDDYGSFTTGPKAAVTEILDKYPNAFRLHVPKKSKFAVLTKKVIG